MVRIGFLGVAHLHADAYVGNLRAAGAEVVGVHDRDPVRARSWGARFGVPVHEDVDSLLAASLDAVVVCSETAHHAALVERAAASGCAVLCEKPLGVGAADSARIVAACHRAGVPLMTAFPVRFSPAVRSLRALLDSGGLGALRAFSGTNQSVMPTRERAWFADPVLAGGGAMMDHIVHLADVFCWLLDAVPEQVYAVGNRIVHSDVVPVETSGLVLLDFPGGVFASIDCSWNRPLDYPTWGGIGLSAVGDGGTVEVDAMRQRLTRFGGGQSFGWTPWGVDINQLMIDEFLDAVREQREPAVTGRDGLVATTVALAALESVASGAPVPWPDV
ncbi:MAG: Oxidoreductase [Blastococcus sp.]|jgi:predicted dehydrogenase|nr:Oxidoreductase [Blastococcus sp.]